MSEMSDLCYLQKPRFSLKITSLNKQELIMVLTLQGSLVCYENPCDKVAPKGNSVSYCNVSM